MLSLRLNGQITLARLSGNFSHIMMSTNINRSRVDIFNFVTYSSNVRTQRHDTTLVIRQTRRREYIYAR